MKKGVSPRDLCLCVFVLCLAAAALFYNLVYTKLTDNIESLRTSNSALSARLDTMKIYYDNEPQYKEDITSMDGKIVAIAQKYPSRYTEEDFLYEAIQMEDVMTPADEVNQIEGTYITYENINIDAPKNLKTVTEENVLAAGLDNYQNEMSFRMRNVTYSNSTSYSSLKDALGVVMSSDYLLNIQNVSYSCDEETGELTGSIGLGYYYLAGNGAEYVAPVFEGYEGGATNIFLNGYFVPVSEEEETQNIVSE